MGLTPEDVLAGLPAWDGASVSELHGGLTNRTWLVTQDGRKAVLKIDEQARSEPYNTRPVEAGIQSIAANHGLANAVLHADARVLLTEYVEGEVWEPELIGQDDNIEVLAAAMRRLHTLPLTGRTFDSIVAARRYAANIDNGDGALVAHCTKIIETKRLPHNLCCCHNDLVAANIIVTPDLKFLDWEYACDNDPFFDLATVVEHHELDEEFAFRLLNAYFEGGGERWLGQLRDQQALYLALYWLWLASRPDAAQDELDALAARISC